MEYSPCGRSRWLDIGQVLFCVFMDQDRVEVHKLTKKNTVRPISSHLDQTSLANKRFINLYTFCGIFSCQTQWVVLSSEIAPSFKSLHTVYLDC